jgi:hypothetical protein
MASDPGPSPLTTHEEPEGRHPASDPAVQAESPGPEPARHPDIPVPGAAAHPDRPVGRTMAAFSAADRTLWWGAAGAAGAGVVVGAAWGAAGRRYPV